MTELSDMYVEDESRRRARPEAASQMGASREVCHALDSVDLAAQRHAEREFPLHSLGENRPWWGHGRATNAWE